MERKNKNFTGNSMSEMVIRIYQKELHGSQEAANVPLALTTMIIGWLLSLPVNSCGYVQSPSGGFCYFVTAKSVY